MDRKRSTKSLTVVRYHLGVFIFISTWSGTTAIVPVDGRCMDSSCSLSVNEKHFCK
nr:MAG TPA: hypothetical protein [Bacteriophage sp.]